MGSVLVLLVRPGAARGAPGHGRDDVWGVGLPMSVEAADTENAFDEFMDRLRGDYVTPDGRLVIDQPEFRQAIVKALDS